MILSLQQGLAQDGLAVSMVKLCQWFQVPRRTVYYRSTKAAPKLQEHLGAPIKAMIEENPSFGYRTVAHLLRMNKNTVLRILQIKGWQVRKRPVGFRPRIQTLSRALYEKERVTSGRFLTVTVMRERFWMVAMEVSKLWRLL